MRYARCQSCSRKWHRYSLNAGGCLACGGFCLPEAGVFDEIFAGRVTMDFSTEGDEYEDSDIPEPDEYAGLSYSDFGNN